MSSNLVGKIIWLNNSNIVYDKNYINIEETKNEEENNNNNNNENNNKILAPFDNIYLYGNVKEYDKVFDNYLIETNNILKNKIEKIKYQVNDKNVKEFNPNILININNLDELKENEISAEEINYFFIKKYENKQNFYNLNNKILIQLTNYYENNKDLNYKKLYKFINKILKEKNNNSLIFIGKQNSNKINCFIESLNYILNKNSKYEKIKTIFENCFNVYKLFNENIKNKPKNNLLIQIEFNKLNNNINLIRFIPNCLISLSKKNLFKIIYVIINIFSNENNDEIIEKFNIKTIQKEKLKFLNIYDFNKDLEIEYKFLYNLFKNIQLNESEIKLLINILLSLIFLLNNEINNFCSLLNINNFDFDLISENKFHLIKFIYFKIFEWLIKKINSNLNFNNNNKNSEIYTINFYYNKGFEYLLEDNLNTMINNYSYEKIFNLFIKKNINDVFDEYDSENIIINKIKFDVVDNKEIINLFEKEIFEIINKFNENKEIIENINKINNNSFGNLENNFLLIFHSFGEVFYDFLNVFEENILINKKTIEILEKSENKYFLKIILNKNNNKNNNNLTLINYYLKQIKENFNILNFSNCNFIFSFEYNKSLFKQILSSSICEIYNFNNEKYVFILTQEKFLNIMKILSNNIKNNLENKKDLINEKNKIKIKGLIMSLIPILYEENEEFLNVFENDEIQIGISKIFINKKGMKILLKSLNKINKIKLIQKCFRNYKKNNKFILKKENSFFNFESENFENENLNEKNEKNENLNEKNENLNEKNENLNEKNKINELLKKIEEISKEKNELLKENEKLKNNNEILKINNLNLIKTSKFKKKRTNSIIPEVDDLKESDENEKLKEKIKELENKIKDLEKNKIYFNYLQKENNKINKLNEELQKNFNKEKKLNEENKKILNEFKKKLGIEINFDENNKIQILSLKDNLKNLFQNEKNLKEIIKHKNKIISNKKKELNYFSNLIIIKNLFIQIQKNNNKNNNKNLNNLIQKKIENLKENENKIIKKLNFLFKEDEKLFINDKNNSSDEEENENNLNINKINLMNIESEEKNDEFEFIKNNN